MNELKQDILDALHDATNLDNGRVSVPYFTELLDSILSDQYNMDNVGKRNGSGAILKAMSDHNISQETYDTLGKIHDEICAPANKGNWPIRININYV